MVAFLYTEDVCGDMGLQVLGRFCKKLHKLNHKGLVTHVGLIVLAKGCTNLESLKVILGDISNKALECLGTHLKNLRKLCMKLVKKDRKIDIPLDNGILAMLMGCRKLKRLDITVWHGGLTDVGLEYIGKYVANLRSLSLTLMGNSNEGLVKLSKGCLS
ncbi:leucine-rich repeat, cysteine-containing subtype protein [Tanacetum coccineum]